MDNPALGPVIIGFDGSSSANYTVRVAASLLAPAPALVVVAWEAGLGFELLENPPSLVPAPLDIRSALAVDQKLYEIAQRLAETGAAVARRSGLDATGLAVADDATVADTLLRLCEENNARAVVVGAHGRQHLAHEPPGGTARQIVQSAQCPAVVIRHPGPKRRGEHKKPLAS